MDTVESKILEFVDPNELAEKAAEYINNLANEYIKLNSRFTIALSGGSSPKRVYERLGGTVFGNRMPWDKIFIFWGDERIVDYRNKDSNFYTAERTLLSKINIPKENVFRIEVEESPPEKAVSQYEYKMKIIFKKFGAINTVKQTPVFDLALLGVGEDGHTASLFPGSDALNEKNKWVAYVKGMGNPPVIDRITLTLPVFNSAQNIMFIVSGKGKGEIVKNILSGAGKYPASLIKPEGQTVWFIDKDIYNNG